MTKSEPTRIARLFLPDVDAASSILPSDKWLVKNAADIVKSNTAVRREMLRAAGLSTLTLAGMAATAAAAAAFFPVGLTMAAVCCIGFGLCALLGGKIGDSLKSLREKALPEVRAELATRYIRQRTDEIAAAWRKNLEKRGENPAPEKKQEASLEPLHNGPSLKKNVGKWAFAKAFSRKNPTAEAKQKIKNTPAP